jgi:outer membrane protein TolC
VDAVFLHVAYRIKKAYYDLAFLSRSISITKEHLKLLTQWESVARSRYATGVGSYADIIKAQVELGKLSDRLDELQDRYRPLAASLNAVLNRPVGAVVPWPAEYEATGGPVDEAELFVRLEQKNPVLISLGHQADSFLQAEKLAGKQRYPDLTFGVNYIQTGDARMEGVLGSGTDPLLASLSINIPLWRGKYSAAEREAAENFRAVSSTRTDRANLLAADLERALFGYRDALRKMDLYGDTLLPKGRQSLGATAAAYETGKAGFLDVVDAERILLEFQLSHARAAADLMINSAEIEMLVGGPVSFGADN